MRRDVSFLLNGVPCTVADFSPTTTVLAWLRRQQRLTGTKEGCGEGDCGACTILMGELKDGTLAYRPLNACIAFIAMLDGTVVRTIEGLSGPDGALHPVQQAMVDCHGSQCGFCTPGFVMAMAALYSNVASGVLGQPSPQTFADHLSGNLCRCTGYGPILAACARMFALQRPEWDRVREAADRNWLLSAPTTPVMIGDPPSTLIPTTLDDLAAWASHHPDATLVSGGTDVGLWVTKKQRELSPVIHTRRVADYGAITRTATGLRLGAGASFTDAHRPLAAWSPDLGELVRRIGGPQVRASGTIGGNIANGSPIGDLAPAFIALGATLHLRAGSKSRSMRLEDFFEAYGRQARAGGEILVAVDLPAPGDLFRVYKVSKRFDDDISAVCAAFNFSFRHGRIASARVAYGGMAGTPKRALLTEQALVGTPFDDASVARAATALEQDFTPLTDARASAHYRRTVAQNLLRRALVDTGSRGAAPNLVGPRAAF